MREPKRYTASEWLEECGRSHGGLVVYPREIADAEKERADELMFEVAELKQEIEFLQKERALRFA